MRVSSMGAARRLALSCASFMVMAVSLCHAQSQGEVSISGVPLSAVGRGDIYVFQPNAVVRGSGIPLFEIENKPAWAEFDALSGRLSGRPGDADGGVYAGILISITDGSSRASLPAFSVTVYPLPEQALRTVEPSVSTISWLAPMENVDGTALTDLAGYRVYAGPSPGLIEELVTISNVGLLSVAIEGLQPGQHVFAVSALNSAGMEGELSEYLYVDIEDNSIVDVAANTVAVDESGPTIDATGVVGPGEQGAVDVHEGSAAFVDEDEMTSGA